MVEEIKRAWGNLTPAHPCIQTFALPPPKDKQCSQPTPSDFICKPGAIPLTNIIRYSSAGDKNHPRRRLSLHYLCGKFQSCEV